MKASFFIQKIFTTALFLLPGFHLFAQYTGGSGSGQNSNSLGACVIVLGIESSPLYGELLENKKGRLYWETYSEVNNSGFEIQRSYDGLTWRKIGWVNGAGNSTHALEYEFIDPDLSPEIQYYRFKQDDFSGQVRYSNIVFLDLKASVSSGNNFVLFPNPAHHGINMQFTGFSDNEPQVIIEDLFGRIIYQEKITLQNGAGLYTFEKPPSMACGIYFVNILGQNENIPPKKLIIQ